MLGKKVNILLLTLLMLLSTAVSAAVNTQYNATVCGSGTYLFGCKQLTSSGTKTNTLGDSTVTLHLLFAPLKATSYTATIEPGQTYLFGCQQLTADTVTSNTLQQVGCGCDSTVNLTLKVQAPAPTKVVVGYTATIQKGETYLFGCATYASDTTVSDTLHLAGKDSIVVLTLKVEETPVPVEVKVGYTATIQKGETYLFGCATYAKVGYTATIQKGETYLFGCATYASDTTVSDTLHLTGKDSIVVLTLKVESPVLPDTTVAYTATIKQGETYLFGCQQLTAADTYRDTLHLAGKDSITVLTLKVCQPDSSELSLTVCDSITWKGTKYTTSGDYTFDTLTVLGCDSVITLHLTVNHSDSSEVTLTVCDSITWKGTKYTTSGDYTFDTLTVAGCDSVITLHLTVNHSDSSEVTLTACDSITWKGTKYTTSGDYTFDTLTVAGCDSVITLHLTIYHSESSTEVVDTCNMYTWHGVRYTKTDIYYDTLQTVHGCDSICKLDLTITLPYQDTLTLEHYYGDRVIMINRHEINALGWKLDSLDLDHPEYVKWYRINAPGDTTFLDNGYYYTLTSGEPLPAGTYFAVITIEPGEGARCGAKGMTETYTVTGAAPAPALMPSLARPGQDIRIVNLNPMVQTNVRIYSADGLVQGSYTVSGEESYTIKAAGTTGFYLVELYNEGMKSTLRYIVK